MWTQIRRLLQEQSDLDLQCSFKRLLNISADDIEKRWHLVWLALWRFTLKGIMATNWLASRHDYDMPYLGDNGQPISFWFPAQAPIPRWNATVCGISSGSALFANIKNNMKEMSTCDPLNTKQGIPYLLYPHAGESSSEWRGQLQVHVHYIIKICDQQRLRRSLTARTCIIWN